MKTTTCIKHFGTWDEFKAELEAHGFNDRFCTAVYSYFQTYMEYRHARTLYEEHKSPRLKKELEIATSNARTARNMFCICNGFYGLMVTDYNYQDICNLVNDRFAFEYRPYYEYPYEFMIRPQA